jgi:ATP-binding cassette, subfamily B (MDR/TAP), member 1
VVACPGADGGIPAGFDTCKEYWQQSADEMQDDSFRVSGFWAILMFTCITGYMLVFWGFGTASERLNKRVRDTSFTALLRQEVAFFDKRSVGSITSQLQDDAARIHAFSGEPVRVFIIAMTSVVTGVVISFVVSTLLHAICYGTFCPIFLTVSFSQFMWQFALLAIGCVPVMGFATSMEMKKFLGDDEGNASAVDELNTPGGIIVETLINIRTVFALNLEQQRYADYEHALQISEPNYRFDAFTNGLTSGLSMFIQQWVNGKYFLNATLSPVSSWKLPFAQSP